jgi:mRNA interferase RelE/StbE
VSSNWKIEFTSTAIKSLSKLDKQVAQRIFTWLDERILVCNNPRLWGKQLQGSKFGENWCYQVGTYRILCNIEDHVLTVTVVEVDHRKQVYR